MIVNSNNIICSYCRQKIKGLPRKCGYCRKFNCEKHVHPESHKCKYLKKIISNENKWMVSK